jgi:hypothetical protein
MRSKRKAAAAVRADGEGADLLALLCNKRAQEGTEIGGFTVGKFEPLRERSWKTADFGVRY